MKKHYAPTSTGKTAIQPEPVATVHANKVPVDIRCEHCQRMASYCVPMRRSGVLYDVYICDENHYTYVKSPRESSAMSDE